jgi:hypothetical protein
MAKARFHGLPHRGVRKDDLPAVRDVTAGKYTYTPGVAHSPLEASGTLHCDGARVELQVTESLLREFLTLLEAAQEELNQRWNGQGNSACHTDRA